MKYLQENEQSKNLISNFLQENTYMPTKIRFDEDSVFVAAAENDSFIDSMFASMMSIGYRSVGLLSSFMTSSYNEYIKDRLFIVNDFEFYSVFDIDEQVSFTAEWREYMAINLPEEQQEDYKKDLETYTKQNIWENI